MAEPLIVLREPTTVKRAPRAAPRSNPSVAAAARGKSRKSPNSPRFPPTLH